MLKEGFKKLYSDYETVKNDLSAKLEEFSKLHEENSQLKHNYDLLLNEINQPTVSPPQLYLPLFIPIHLFTPIYLFTYDYLVRYCVLGPGGTGFEPPYHQPSNIPSNILNIS